MANGLNGQTTLWAKFTSLIIDNDGEVRWTFYQGLAIVAGIGILIVYSAKSPAFPQSLAVGLLVAGASLACGIFIGFLFGIPRTVQKPQAADGTTASQSDSGVNTNLEQISDWLTKIIVGVGFVQLSKMPPRIKALVEYMSSAFADQKVSPATVLTIMAYFAIFGFLLGYLWTRIYLTREFNRVERQTRDRPEFFEGLIHAFLYQPMPTGFKYAIAKADEYKQRFGMDNWRVWFYLACAYAQQYTFEKRAPKPDEQKKNAARDNSLDAVQHALQLNQDAKPIIRGLWDPAQAKPTENDLQVFYEDK